MGGLAPWHWVLIIVVLVVLFGGKGKLSGLMGDAAKGIKEFKSGLKDDEEKPVAAAPPVAPAPAPLPAETVERERDKA